MTLPRWIRIRVTANGAAARHMFVKVRVRMRRKNDYYLGFGPSDEDGQIAISQADLVSRAREELNFFVMDYAEIEKEHTGEIAVAIFEAEQIDRAIAAYDGFAKAGFAYPPDWKVNLAIAREVLRAGVGRVQLEVKLEDS